MVRVRRGKKESHKQDFAFRTGTFCLYYPICILQPLQQSCNA